MPPLGAVGPPRGRLVISCDPVAVVGTGFCASTVVAWGWELAAVVVPPAPLSPGETLVEDNSLPAPVPGTVLLSSTDGAFEGRLGSIMIMVVSSTVYVVVITGGSPS